MVKIVATKKENFAEVVEFLTENDAPQELIEAVAKEVALLEKRAGATRKPTNQQKENEALKVQFVELIGAEEDGLTATEVARAAVTKDGEPVTVQRAAQLLKQLVNAGEIKRVPGKGKNKTRFVAAE